MAGNDSIIPDEDDIEEEEQENEDVLEEVGEDRRDPDTGSVESAEDLRTLPEEITGRAAASEEDLTTLFRHADGHVTDGFRGGSDDDPADTLPGDDSDVPDVD